MTKHGKLTPLASREHGAVDSGGSHASVGSPDIRAVGRRRRSAAPLRRGLRAVLLPLLLPIVVTLVAGPPEVRSEDPAAPPAAAPPVADDGSALTLRQQRVRRLVEELDGKFKQLAKALRESEPEQAERLIAALQEAQAMNLAPRMKQVADLLDGARLDAASGEQRQLLADIERLLQRLTTDPDASQPDQERRRRLEAWRHEARRLQADQQALQVETDQFRQQAPPEAARRAETLEQLTARQTDAARRAQSLASAMRSTTSEPSAQPVRPDDSAAKPDAKPAPKSDATPTPRPDEKPDGAAPENASNDSTAEASKKPGDKPGDAALDAPAGAPHVDRASEAMTRAAEKLRAGDAPAADAPQASAIAELQKAIDALNQELDDSPNDQGAQLEARLRDLLRRQQPLSFATAETETRRGADGALRRADRLALAKLATDERVLSEDAGALRETLDEQARAAVFPDLLAQIKLDLETIAARLEDRRTDASTRALQREVEAALQELIDALQTARQSREAEPSEATPAGDEEAGPAPLLPPSAELKLLKARQSRVNRRTAAIETPTKERPLSAAALDELQELARQQAAIEALARRLAERLAEETP